MKCSRIVVVFSLVGPFLALFGSILFSGQSFGFRDSSYYYYPLFEWTAAEWGEGTVPLWNPLDNCGTPLVADSTSSVFYPGKLVFAFPIAFYWRFKLYVLLHVGLAAVAAFLVARRWRASSTAAAVCAVSYAFGGYVIFQHCNVVFLVSASWLPFAVLFADRMLVKRSIRSSILFGGILALMVLGGDPQTAYHAGLVSALYAVLLWRRDRNITKKVQPDRAATLPERMRALPRSRPLLLALAAGVGGLLAAVQILPSIEWSRTSQRAMYERPRNVYEASAYVARSNADGRVKTSEKWHVVREGIFDRPQPGTHHDHIYQFSIGPWRLTELVWPNVSGKMYPINRRWANVIPGEDRTWTPSLYIGLLPLLLGVSAIRIRRGNVRQRWLSWCAILATIGSFGWYGIGWLLQEFQVGLFHANPNAATIGEPVGGLYWLMVVLLPGYAYFRFPAKLLVVASLALSLLAARGWDRAMLQPSKRLRRVLIILALTSLAGLVFSFVGTSIWYGWVSNAPGDDIWGPLDGDGALRDLRFTLASTLCISALCLWLLHLRKNSSSRFATYIPHLLLIITAADIAIANRWMIATVDDSIVTTTIPIGQMLSSKREAERFRIYRGNPDRWVPGQWRWNWSPDRVAENYQWQRRTIYPRHHLPLDLPYTSSPGTIAPADYTTMLAVSRGHGIRRPDGIYELHPSTLDALSVEYLLLPGGFRYPGHQVVESPDGKPLPDDFSVWHNPHRFPRCWIVRDVKVFPPLEAKSPHAIANRTVEILFPDGKARDLRRSAVVERAQQLPELDDLAQRPATSTGESCEIVVDERGRIELQVKLDSPALVVLNDYYYPGWVAVRKNVKTYRSEEIEILRTNRTMRGIVLPTGHHRIAFKYRPAQLYIGAGVSGIAWLLAGTASLCFGLRKGSLERRRED